MRGIKSHFVPLIQKTNQNEQRHCEIQLPLLVYVNGKNPCCVLSKLVGTEAAPAAPFVLSDGIIIQYGCD